MTDWALQQSDSMSIVVQYTLPQKRLTFLSSIALFCLHKSAQNLPSTKKKISAISLFSG